MLEAADADDFEAIEKSRLNSLFKNKLLMVYYPDKVIPVCVKNTLDAYSELLESAPDFIKDITDKLTIFNIYYTEFVRTYKQFFSYADEIKSDNILWNFLINFYDLPII